MEDERKINWLSLFIKIIIVFVFILIIIWLISKIINNNKLSETFKNNINNMEEVATTYFKKIDLPTEEGKSIKLTLEEMIEKEIIVSMNEDSKNTCNVKKSYSKITRNKKDYTIETKLECGKEKDTITKKFSFKDCKNCNNNNKSNEQEINNNDENNNQNISNNNKVTYYEYVKETTTYSKWMKGTKTGSNIENKYEYYKIDTKTYYTLGTIEDNISKAEYTIKLNQVPNKEYYFTTIENVKYLSNNEEQFTSNTSFSIVKGTKINNIPSSIEKYSLKENEFKYKLLPYYYNGDFYIDVTLENIDTVSLTYKEKNQKVYFVPLEITVKFASNKITSEKPTGDYETITYYRYVEKNKETKWSTETYLDGYTKTGNTKVE